MARIFLVDDDRDLANLIKIVLMKSGHEVFIYYDVSEALENARKQPPHLILMDVILPAIDGADVVKELNRDPVLANIPLIFQTGLFTEEERGKEVKIDGRVYQTVRKPYTIDRLVKAVQDSLNTALKEK